MAGYGYTYRTVATYNNVREESRGPTIKPFAPFVPNTNSNSEGRVTRKTIVPVASRPYDDDDDDDDYNKKHGSPSDEWHRQKSPVRGSPRKVDEFLTKVQNEASRPKRSGPVASTDWRHSPQPYSSPNGYGDYGGNKEGHKPVGGTNYNRYNGTNGYGDYGSKEGRKPVASSTIRNDGTNGYGGGYGDYNNKEGHKPSSSPKYGDYDGANSGYGSYGGNYDNKEGHRPYGSTKYNGHNGGNGYDDYGNYKPTSNPVRKDKYDGYDHGANNLPYNNKEGHMPFGSSPRSGNYDGYNGGNGYGDYGSYNNNKEGQRPISSPNRNEKYDSYDGANNGYGNYNNKEGPRPFGSGPKPKISTAWTAPPRKGTQLSEPTTDIDKAIELLKEAAKVSSNDHSNKGGPKPPTSNTWAASLIGDSRHGEPRSKLDKGMNLVKEAERLKNIVTGSPQSRFSAPKPAKPNKDDYAETIDKRSPASRYGNFNLSSRPNTPPSHVKFIDGRDAADYSENADRRGDTRRYGNEPVIDSRIAAEKYGGKSI